MNLPAHPAASTSAKHEWGVGAIITALSADLTSGMKHIAAKLGVSPSVIHYKVRAYGSSWAAVMLAAAEKAASAWSHPSVVVPRVRARKGGGAARAAGSRRSLLLVQLKGQLFTLLVEPGEKVDGPSQMVLLSGQQQEVPLWAVLKTHLAATQLEDWQRHCTVLAVDGVIVAKKLNSWLQESVVATHL